MVTEIDEIFLKKIKNEKERKEHFATVDLCEKEHYERAKDYHAKLSRTMRKDLSAMRGVLYSMCHISVTNIIKTEDEHLEMSSNKRHNETTLLAFIRKIYNGSASVTIEDVIGNVLESLCIFMLIRGEDNGLLANYLEVSDHRFELSK